MVPLSMAFSYRESTYPAYVFQYGLSGFSDIILDPDTFTLTDL